jgi:hypothetical protein
MAEETNVPNEGVDELSQKSEFIAPASIGANLYKPLTPPVFDIRNMHGTTDVSNSALRIKDSTVGSTPNYPRAVSSDTKKYNKAAGLFDAAIAKIDANVDKNAYNKLYGFDSSPKGAHKARYKAYGQETYDKIGFSPEIDNETWFNHNTTMYDDWKRMATQAAWPMMKLGFMSPIKSYGKLMGGADIGQDIAEARDYEEFNAIGMSTKGGVGGFLINLQNSAAYSVGILAEGVVEGALIGGAIGAIGGEGVGAAPGALLGGVTEGFASLLKLPANLINMSKNLGKMTMNLKKLQNISEVRNVFDKAGRAMGNFINPLSNTSEAAMKYVFNNPDDLSNLARTARTVGSMWHDVKNLNLALSEGRLEGGFTENRVYDELYNKYYNEHGVAPNEELEKQMRQQAKVAGFQNTWKNTLLVHYSNQIAFPSITRAKFAKGLPKFSETIGKVGAEYKLVFNPGKTVQEGLYDFEKISLLNSAKSLVKPATWGKHGLGYLKANFVEGFQETAQDVLANATEEYYINSFQNKDRQNFEYSMATLNAAMKKQISAQGLETFASGFAMGSILSIPGGVKDFLSVGYNKYYKHRADYDQYIIDREAEITEIKDALNTMHKNGKYFFDPRLNNYTTQMLVGKVADQPEGQSTKESKDVSFAGFYSAVQTALRTGTFDTFLKNFEEYKQATPEEIEDAWRLEPGQGQKALLDIDNAITNAKVIAQNYDYTRKKLKAVVNPNDFAENTPERELANIYNEAYLQGVNSLVFMNAAFTNNAERLSKMYSKLASLPTIQSSRFSDISILTEPERLKKEIAMLRTEVKLGEQALTPEAKEQYTKQKDLLEKLEAYQKEQSAATVDFAKRILMRGVEIIKAEPGITPNEARAKAVEQVTAEYKAEGLDPFQNYKASFKSVLNSIAGSEDKIVALDREIDNNGGLDDLFETLMDTHALRNENMNLNKFINILNSPKDFYEHVQRNFEWMKKLYDNRQDYYDDVINNSLTSIQRNTLLEDLADEGIFVDLEEFARWCEDKTLPTYFIDQVNKRIINQDSYLYDKYIEKFKMAEDAEVTNPPVRKSDAEKKLEANIKDLNEKRNSELETVKNIYNRNLKELIGYTQDEIDEQRNEANFDAEMSADELAEKIDLVEKSIEQLKSSNAIEIEAVVDLVSEQDLLTADEVNSAKEDIFADEDAMAEIADMSQKFTDVEEDEAFDTALNVVVLNDLLANKLESLKNFNASAQTGIPEYESTKPYEDYNKSVDEITKKYDDLIADLKAKFEEAKKTDVESKRPEEMKKSIQEVKDIFKGGEDVVQTKRNYVVDGELHERMSNRIKSGYDTYAYTGAEELSQLIDDTILAALKGGSSETQKTDIEKRRRADVLNAIPEDDEFVIYPEQFDQFNREGDEAPKGSLSGKDIEYNIQQAINEEIEYSKNITGSRQVSDAIFVKGKIPKLQEILANVKEINDKYDKAIDATLKGESIADQKADIERRRKEEIARESEKAKKISPNGITYNMLNKINDRYNAELAALEEIEEITGLRELDQAMIDDFMVALEEADLPGVNSNKYTLPIVRDELETLIAPEGTRLTQKVQKNISRLEDEVKAIDAKLASVKDKEREALLKRQKAALEKAIKDEQSGTYSEKFEMSPENLKAFISNTVKENAYQESRDGGDLIDPMLKEYLDTESSTKPKFNPEVMTKEAYDALFDDETGYLTRFKKMADAGEIFIFTKNLYVSSNNLVDAEGNKLPPVAGEIDMIIVDRKGNKYIVDLKTGKTDKWMNYKVLNSRSYEKQLENTLQQTGYANLAQNMSGQEFGIKIFPLEVAYDKNGKMITAGKPSNPVLFSDEEVVGDEGTEPYTIALNKDNVITAKNPTTNAYEVISIANLMQRLVPNLKVKPKTTGKAKPVNKMIPEEERSFVDNFVKELEEEAGFENITNMLAKLDEAKPRLSYESYNMLKALIDSKAMQMFEEGSDIDIKMGEIYIFTQPFKSQKIPEGYRVIVNSFNPETGVVELSRVGPGRKKSFEMDIKEFSNITLSEEMVNQEPKSQEQYEPTDTELEHIGDSLSVTGSELSDFEQLAKWNEEASSDDISPDQLKNDFFTNFKC